MRTMYAITHINRSGTRTLTFGNQGRNHYETREAAEKALKEFRAPGGLPKVLNAAEVASLEVRWIIAYDHGDAIGIWFDTENSLHERKGEESWPHR